MALRRVNQRVNQRVSRAQCSFAAWVLGTRNDTDINVDMDPPHSPHNHFTTRRGMRAKYKQPYVAQSEVTDMYLVSPYRYLDPNLIIAIYLITSPSQGRAPEVSGLYDITSKWQLRTRVNNPMHSWPNTDAHTQTSTRAD